MARDVWQKTITSLSGDALDGAQITVRDQQTNALSAVFDAQSGGSQRPNPFLTGADGVARFFAEPGFYKVTAFKDGFGTAEFIWNNLGDNNLRVDLPDSAGNIYARSNILGTVSQSGGVPTGAIIQRGSNANGEFVRYADGTLICHRQFTTAFNNADSITFPSAFINTTYSVAYNCNMNSSQQINTSASSKLTTGITSVRILDQSFTGANATGLEYTAIGRWF